MTMEQAIERVKELRPTSLGERELAGFIAALDGRAHREATGRSGDPVAWPENAESVLFIPYPFDEAYVWYALAEISAANNDTNAYQNDATIFNEKYTAWIKDYKSTHGRPRTVWRGMHRW